MVYNMQFYRTKDLPCGKLAVREVGPDNKLSEIAVVFNTYHDFFDWMWSGMSGEPIGRRLSLSHRKYKTEVGFEGYGSITDGCETAYVIEGI